MLYVCVWDAGAPWQAGLGRGGREGRVFLFLPYADVDPSARRTTVDNLELVCHVR